MNEKKQKMSCSNGHRLIEWIYNGNKKNKPVCPVCHNDVI